MKENLKEVEAEAIQLQEALKETTAENMKLKENLLDKENELQSMFQENDELRSREAESIKKLEELSKLLEEATTRNHTEENGDLTDSEKDYDLLPKVVEFSEENGLVGEDISKVELSVNQEELKQNNMQEDSILSNDKAEKIESPKHEEVSGKRKEDETKEKEESKEKDDSVEVEYKMWESCKIEKKEFSPEREAEPESFEEEVNSKINGGLRSTYLKLLCYDYHLMEACLWGFYGGWIFELQWGPLIVIFHHRDASDTYKFPFKNHYMRPQNKIYTTSIT